MIGSSCAHCGEPCGDEALLYEGHPFCCQGCRLVFHIIQENGLGMYYELEPSPGATQRGNKAGTRFDALRDAEVVSELTTARTDGCTLLSLSVPQIHCSSCIWLLESLPRLDKGVLRTEVDLPNKRLRVTLRDEDLDPHGLALLLDRIGYPPDISASLVQRTEGRMMDKPLLYRLGIAGFCAGNIMLLSFPEYLGIPDDDGYVRFFNGLNLLLSLPVVFYSAVPYFRSAIKALRIPAANIDQPIALGIAVLFLRSAYEVLSGTGPGYFDSLAGLVLFLLIGKWYQSHTYRALAFDRDPRTFLPVMVTRLVGEQREMVRSERLRKGDRILVHPYEIIPADGTVVQGEGQVDMSFMTGEATPALVRQGEAVFAGGRQLGAALEILVERPAEASYLMGLLQRSGTDRTARPRLKVYLDRLGKRFTIAVITIAALTGAYWAVHDAALVWTTVTAVLIVACPCALALSWPFGVGMAARILGRNGCYLKDPSLVEQLADIRHVVLDKTGTLTQGLVEVDVQVRSGDREEALSLARTAASRSAHPLSRILYAASDTPMRPFSHAEEIIGQGVQLVIEGRKVRLGSAAFTGVPSGPGVHLSADGVPLATFRIQDRSRPGIEAMLRHLSHDVDLHLLTGDPHPDLDWAEGLFPREHILTGCDPEQKRAYVERLTSTGKVLMIGDGINDAGALAVADVGMSVSRSISELTPACDALILPNALHLLGAILTSARKTMKAVRWSVVVSLAYNLVGLSFAVQGLLTPLVAAVLMPLSSVTIVVLVSGMAHFSARSTGLR